MLNTQVNTEHVNQSHLLAGATPDSIEFNGYSLMSLCGGAATGIIVQRANFFDLTNINVEEFVANQIDGGGIINKKYDNKQLTLTLMLQQTSYQTLLDAIDDLKKNLQYVEAELNILVGSSVRTYTATVTGIKIPNFNKFADYLEGIDVSFTITSPHWFKSTPTAKYIAGVVGDFTRVVNNVGTYKSDPKIILVCKSSGNAVTQIAIELKKVGDASGYTVTLTAAITDNDVVIFDYKNKVVTINDVEQNFSGVMTELETGFNNFDISFTGTVNADAYILYNETFL